jgi:hypothetical protein
VLLEATKHLLKQVLSYLLPSCWQYAVIQNNANYFLCNGDFDLLRFYYSEGLFIGLNYKLINFQLLAFTSSDGELTPISN